MRVLVNAVDVVLLYPSLWNKKCFLFPLASFSAPGGYGGVIGCVLCCVEWVVNPGGFAHPDL